MRGNKKAIEEYVRNRMYEDKQDEQLAMKESIYPFTGQQIKQGIAAFFRVKLAERALSANLSAVFRPCGVFAAGARKFFIFRKK